MKLLEATQLGNISLKNRMGMAAMTRSRASANGLVNDLTATYYAQRAGAGFILSEGINISRQAQGGPFTPGIFTQAQIEAWQKVTQAVHNAGSKIFAQLWHTGRAGHSIDKDGQLPVAPSAIAISGAQHFTSQGMKDYETPHALTIDEIRQIIKDYGQAAQNALEAGFDGVELHGANGYLPHQFLVESANQRTDAYGGSMENQCRFMLEALQEIIRVVGGGKVGIKLSPLHTFNGAVAKDPIALFTYLIQEINQLDVLFVELMRRSPMFSAPENYPKADEIELFGKIVKTTVMANAAYTRETGEAELQKGIAQLISYGVLFLANPDLPQRFEHNAPLNMPDRAAFFGGGEKGYTDYPFMEQ